MLAFIHSGEILGFSNCGWGLWPWCEKEGKMQTSFDLSLTPIAQAKEEDWHLVEGFKLLLLSLRPVRDAEA